MAREEAGSSLISSWRGPSDENALLEPMQAALNFAANGAPPEARALAFHCDVTTVRPFSVGRPPSPSRTGCATPCASSSSTASRRGTSTNGPTSTGSSTSSTWTAPSYRTSASSTGGCDGFVYGRDSITARDTARVVDRNERKSAALLELAGTRELKHRKHAVPYRVYFMSRNLEHALYGSVREFSDDEKRQLSAAFGKKYRNDPEGFINLLRSGDVKVPGDTVEETWRYARERH